MKQEVSCVLEPFSDGACWRVAQVLRRARRRLVGCRSARLTWKARAVRPPRRL